MHEWNYMSSLDEQTASTVRISYVLMGLEGSSGDATPLLPLWRILITRRGSGNAWNENNFVARDSFECLSYSFAVLMTSERSLPLAVRGLGFSFLSASEISTLSSAPHSMSEPTSVPTSLPLIETLVRRKDSLIAV